MSSGSRSAPPLTLPLSWELGVACAAPAPTDIRSVDTDAITYNCPGSGSRTNQMSMMRVSPKCKQGLRRIYADPYEATGMHQVPTLGGVGALVIELDFRVAPHRGLIPDGKNAVMRLATLLLGADG
ncbi:hypothetical protein BJY52DRAFT_1306305 [Lactarius psammicola]|nr:hypothetical protein BJY52DRAFT_1306305 [Lactarius psammicola]